MVVGDSFAEMWLPVFDEQIASGELQVDTLLKSACPIAVGVAHGRSALEDENCTAWNQEVFAMLAEQDSRYDAIVVGGRYSRKFETDQNRNHRTSGSAYSEAWVTLGKHADKVVVIGVGPEPAIDPLSCIHRNSLEDCWAERPNSTTGNNAAARVFL